MDIEEKKNLSYEKFSNIANYLIIGLVSLVATAFLPMIGTEVGLKMNLPNTTAGWIVWLIGRCSSSIVNILIYHCFVVQAKINCKKDPKFIEANEILSKVNQNRKWKPRSPAKFLSKEYLSKGTSIFVSTIISLIGFSMAILTFDLILFLSMVFTTMMALIFGFIEMKKVEEYWKEEYICYAKMKEREFEEEKERLNVENQALKPEGVKECLISETKNLEISKSK